MNTRFTKNIFENALDCDMPKSNLHVYYNGNTLKIKKDDKKIKYDLNLVTEHFNKVVKKTYENFLRFVATNNVNSINTHFTKGGALLEWGLIRKPYKTIFYQRYSKDGLQALLSTKLIGDFEFIKKAMPIFTNGIEKYRSNFKNFKRNNFNLYQTIKKKVASLKRFRKHNKKYIEVAKIQQFINVDKTLKLEIFDLMCEIAIKNPADMCFINETNYFFLRNFNEIECNEIVKSSEFSTYSSFVISSKFLIVKINDLDYKKEIYNQSVIRDNPRIFNKENPIYQSLKKYAKELSERREEAEIFRKSIYGIFEEEEIIEQKEIFEIGIVLDLEEEMQVYF
jgi:hypothetical protein